MQSRRDWIAAMIGVAAPLVAGLPARAATQAPALAVRKNPGCPCCDGWVVHMRRAGFTVTLREDADLAAYRAMLGVPPDLQSCHTSVAEGYVIEGHVPAAEIRRLLATKPAIAGIAVGGMPIGSPGMEGPNPQPYDVIAFSRDGSRSVFARIRP